MEQSNLDLKKAENRRLAQQVQDLEEYLRNQSNRQARGGSKEEQQQQRMCQIVAHRKMKDRVREQEKTIAQLHKEVERLRQKTFPSFTLEQVKDRV